jgi:mRNA-degrading endonuclease RelE of RelBE toxin-antitoxin system
MKGKLKQNHSKNLLPNYRLIPTQNFLDEAKQLSKKYPRIKYDFLELAKELKKDPISGNDRLVDDCYKVRMQITDKGGGKSGGARVIINIQIKENVIYIISVYDKGRFETIKDFVLKNLLKRILPKIYR